MTDVPNQRTLEVLLDKQEIHELHARYCRGIDRLDPDLVRSTFHPDAIEVHPPWFVGLAHEYVDRSAQHSSGSLRGPWFHMIANELIEVHGDIAYSEMYLWNINRYEEEGVDFFLAGRYVERIERRDGVWRTAWRCRLHDITRVDPIGAIWSESWPPVPPEAHGSKDKDDMSYRIPRPGEG